MCFTKHLASWPGGAATRPRIQIVVNCPDRIRLTRTFHSALSTARLPSFRTSLVDFEPFEALDVTTYRRRSTLQTLSDFIQPDERSFDIRSLPPQELVHAGKAPGRIA